MSEAQYNPFLMPYLRGYFGKDGTFADLMPMAKDEELKLAPFKRKRMLPRVRTVLGMLRQIYPGTLLDVGSGRGVFLWTFLNEFPDVRVTAIEQRESVYNKHCAVRNGGIDALHPIIGDITTHQFNEKFDVVTALEVLEHVPDVGKAIANIMNHAKQYVIFSVPSKEDDNPQHIHLFNPCSLRKLFKRKINFQNVAGHIVGIVKL